MSLELIVLKNIRRTLILLFIVFTCSCVTTVTTVGGADLNVYKRNIISEIKNSDKIVIAEHSNKFDFDPSSDAPEKTYRTVELNVNDKIELIKSVQDYDFIDVSSLCVFEPHHRIEFYNHGVKSSELEICFQCKDIMWSRDGVIHGNLSEIFSKVVISSGLEKSRDWKALAKESLKHSEK